LANEEKISSNEQIDYQMLLDELKLVINGDWDPYQKKWKREFSEKIQKRDAFYKTYVNYLTEQKFKVQQKIDTLNSIE